jgi:hypothetical protein
VDDGACTEDTREGTTTPTSTSAASAGVATRGAEDPLGITPDPRPHGVGDESG